jgi:hypothetical protein
VEGGIAEGGIVGCGISLQYHPLLWWAGLRKVREKYHTPSTKGSMFMMSFDKANIQFLINNSSCELKVH